MIVFLALLVIAGAFAFTLFVRGQDIPEPLPVSPIQHLDDRKHAIYDNLRDLQFEYRLGKLSDEDYQQTKQALQRELAGVLAETEETLKTLGLSSARVPSRAAAQQPQPARASATVCPHCGWHQASAAGWYATPDPRPAGNRRTIQVLVGVGVFGIDIELSLSGPTPWHAKGSGSLSFFFFSVSIPIDVTWGDSRDTSLPPVPVMPILAGELFRPLRDVTLFNQVQIDPEVHTLVWPNGADFDPATLHDWPKHEKALAELACRWEPAPA